MAAYFLLQNADAYTESVKASAPSALDAVKLPPQLQMVPYKPVFYDVAYELVMTGDYNIEQQAANVAQKSPTTEDGKKPGIIGKLLGSLW